MCVHHHIIPPDSFLTPGARSEALASLLLELHGLQDMLEGLWEWVAGAEATMAATEASPVGNDMETVETQLAQHEVCIPFYFNIGHYSLPYNSVYTCFRKQTPINNPTVTLCIREVFVKVHITNKARPPEQDLGLFVFASFCLYTV